MLQTLKFFTFALLAVSSAMAQTVLQQDWEFDASAGEGTVQIDLPDQGLVWLEILEAPEDLDLLADTVSATYRAREYGQFRIPSGTHSIKVWERTGRKAKGRVKIRIHMMPDDDATEPENDKRIRPREVKAGTIPVRIFPTGEVDYLAATMPERGYVFVDAPDAPEGFDLHAEIADEYGNVLGNNAGHVPAPGLVTVRIADRTSQFGDIKKIGIRIRFFADTDFAEPNNTPETAVKTRLNAWHEAAVAPAGDIDHYRLKVSEPGYLQIRAYDPPSFNLSWDLLDSVSKYPVAEGWIMRVPPGDFTLRLKALEDGAFATKPFRFQIVWRATETGAEMEDGILNPGVVTRARIGSPGDSAQLGVRVSQPGIVWFNAQKPEHITPLFQALGGKTSNPLWLRTDPGLVAVKLMEKTGDYDMESFNIWADFETDLDPTEPNDSRALSKQLQMGKPSLCYLYPSDDMDWFGFKTSSRKSDYRFRIHSPDSKLEDFKKGIGIGLTNDEGKPIAQRVAARTGPQSWISEPVSLGRGSFSLWVKGQWGGFSTSPITVTVFPASDPTIADNTLAAEAGVELIGIDFQEEAVIPGIIAGIGAATPIQATSIIDPKPKPTRTETYQPQIEPVSPEPALPANNHTPPKVPEVPREVLTPKATNPALVATTQSATGGKSRWWLWLLIPIVIAAVVFVARRAMKPKPKRRVISISG